MTLPKRLLISELILIPNRTKIEHIEMENRSNPIDF